MYTYSQMCTVHIHVDIMSFILDQGDDLEASEYRAVFAYESDTQGDLMFREGETVLVYWADDNGWWFGSAGSAQGWFPGSYVEVHQHVFSEHAYNLD